MIKIYTNEQYSLTSYLFYTRILEELHQHYKENGNVIPIFSMIYTTRVDPVVIPLIVSLGVYIKAHHKEPVELRLSNTPETNDFLYFLSQLDFFKVVGNHNNPYWTKSRNLFYFNELYIGSLNQPKDYRKEHKLRLYSPDDEWIKNILQSEISESKKRDKLLDEFAVKVDEEFGNLFYDQDVISENVEDFIEILAELLTNGIYHGQTIVPAIMHTNNGVTTLSVSDTGCGLAKSIKNKESTFRNNKRLQTEYPILTDINFSSIIDTLFYSFQNDRRGLFDLIMLVVFKKGGKFWIHNESCQLLISIKYRSELEKFNTLREEIFSEFKNTRIDQEKVNRIKKESYFVFKDLIDKTEKSNSENIKFSNFRSFDVKFPGVHIEVMF